MTILPVQEVETPTIFSEQQQDFSCSQATAMNWDDFYSFVKPHTLEGRSKDHLVNPYSEEV